MVIVVCVAKNSICVAKNSISDCVWHVRRQVVSMLNKTNRCKDTRLLKVTRHCKDKDTKTWIVTLHSPRLIEMGNVSHMANTRLVSRHTCVSIKGGGNSAAKASLFYASRKCGFGRTHKSFR